MLYKNEKIFVNIPMNHIKNHLSSLINVKNDRSFKITIMQEWNAIMGNLASYTSIKKIENTKITILVSDSCLMHELSLLKRVLLQKINNTLPSPIIQELLFQLGKSGQPKIKKDLVPEKPVQKAHNLTPIEQAALKNILDPELQDLLRKLLEKCLQS